MYLNTIAPAEGSRKKAKRVGRGIGCGKGKTCGKGHKGQIARAGGYHKVGFEGGQMPLQRRLPKYGFRALLGEHIAELPLSVLNTIEGADINLAVLQQTGLIKRKTQGAKIILSGSIDRAVNISGIKLTKGARAAIIAAGGKVVD